MLTDEERAARVKAFIKGLKWKGPIFEISALTRDGCDGLVTAIYQYIQTQRQEQQREKEIVAEEVRSILSIDPDDPRFKIREDEA
jgi:GTP-binding protein